MGGGGGLLILHGHEPTTGNYSYRLQGPSEVGWPRCPHIFICDNGQGGKDPGQHPGNGPRRNRGGAGASSTCRISMADEEPDR